MKKFSLANLIDFFVINTIIFLIAFGWLKFFKIPTAIVLICALTIIIIFNFVRYYITSKHLVNQKISKNLEIDEAQYMYSFLSNTNEQNLEFFLKAEQKLNKNFPTSNIVIIENKNLIKTTIDDTTTFISPQFSQQNLSIEKALKTLSQIENYNQQKIIFLCCDCDTKTRSFLEALKNFKVTIYTKSQILSNILSPSGCYPKIKFESMPSKKFKIKELIEISFARPRAKGYFLSGILIFFCSFIVKYNFYYVFMSSLLFFFTLLCLTKDNKKKSN